MSKSLQYDNQCTVVGLTPMERVLILTVPPIIGIVLGYFIPVIANWANQLPWVPFQGPIKLIASIEEKWVVIITAILGLIGGIWLTIAAFRDTLIIVITNDEVHLKIKETVQIFSTADITSIFLEDKKLVLLGKSGVELARENYDSSSDKVEQAFIMHGFSWSSQGDPYDSDYRPWVPETPELSPILHALLKAREQALKKKEEESIKVLHQEAKKLGIVIRDKGSLQYWRKIE
ncbi:YqeB family protein [Shimazuella kribbensis]|uniref:YqeB family protein n=1 Tax=Shimazuella kribbensis TaxID=139808 RepID=UPI0003FBE6C7|nr:hypothetical protein [Shimazuella kribbensis]